MGRITAETQGHLPRSGLSTDRTGRQVRYRTLDGGRTSRHARLRRVRGRQGEPHRPHDRRGAGGQRQRRPAHDRPRSAAVRRAGTRVAAEAAPERSSEERPRPGHELQDAGSSPTSPKKCRTRRLPVLSSCRTTRTDTSSRSRATRRSTTGGSSPTSVAACSRRSSTPPTCRPLEYDENGEVHPGEHPGRPRSLHPRQPGDPGSVQPRIDVQAVHRVRRAEQRTAGAGGRIRRRGTLPDGVDRRGQVQIRVWCDACSRTQRVREPDDPACTAQSTSSWRWPCRVMRSSIASVNRSWCEPGTTRHCSRSRSDSSASVPTPGSTYRSSSTAPCPTPISRRAMPNSGSSPRTRGPDTSPATTCSSRSGRACCRRRRCSSRSGTRRIANGGFVMRPEIIKAIYEPGVPDAAEPGYADISRGPFRGGSEPARRSRSPDSDGAEEIGDEITRGLRRVITGPGTISDYYHSTTGEKLFFDYPSSAIPVAGKTGTAQGASNYPWNDSSAFAAYSIDPERPVHGERLPREGRLRLAGGGPGRQVHLPAVVRSRPVGPGRAVGPARHGESGCRPSRRAWPISRATTVVFSRSVRPSDRIPVGPSTLVVDHDRLVPLAQARLRARQHQGQPGRSDDATSTGC